MAGRDSFTGGMHRLVTLAGRAGQDRAHDGHVIVAIGGAELELDLVLTPDLLAAGEIAHQERTIA